MDKINNYNENLNLNKKNNITNKKEELDYYFNSYSNYHIHEEMLSDKVRTLSYKNSIFKNKKLFKDKIVLDIGCGTGILSLFAAKAGAKHVYGIEKADIYKLAKEIIKDNNYDHKITIINEKVEECNLPCDKVDIIISEWMGYCLLYESMLDSVIFARDKWLRNDGLIFPNKVELYIAGINDYESKYERWDFWEKQYGFNMKAMKKLVKEDVIIDYIEKESVITNKSTILKLDLKECKIKDLEFSNSYELICDNSDQLNGFVLWFDSFFITEFTNINLSTSPYKYSTHWKQSIFYIEDDIPLFKNEKITGLISFFKNKFNIRELDINLTYKFKNENHNINKTNKFKLR